VARPGRAQSGVLRHPEESGAGPRPTADAKVWPPRESGPLLPLPRVTRARGPRSPGPRPRTPRPPQHTPPRPQHVQPSCWTALVSLRVCMVPARVSLVTLQQDGGVGACRAPARRCPPPLVGGRGSDRHEAIPTFLERENGGTTKCPAEILEFAYLSQTQYLTLRAAAFC
jgi:hypothetical protein